MVAVLSRSMRNSALSPSETGLLTAEMDACGSDTVLLMVVDFVGHAEVPSELVALTWIW